MNPVQTAWFDTNLIAILLAINPRGLKGVSVKSQFGPVRDLWLSYFSGLLPTGSGVIKAPANLSSEQLFGSFDIESALSSGEFKIKQGLLARLDGQYLLLPMAERMDLQVVTHISQALDEKNTFTHSIGHTSHHFAVIAFDESDPHEGGISARLSDRLAFEIYLDRFSLGDAKEHLEITWDDIQSAQSLLSAVTCSEDLIEVLINAGLSLGVTSLRANQFAMETAKTLAALRGLDVVGQEEVIDAARLVYSHLRRNQEPREEPADSPAEDGESTEDTQNESSDNLEQSDEENQQDQQPPESPDSQPSQDELEDLVVAAVQASLPPNFLFQLNQKARSAKTRSSTSGKSGSLEQSFLSGRPQGSKKSAPGHGRRLDILKSIRSAIPWQRIRAQQNFTSTKASHGNKIDFRSEDLHVKKYLKRRGTVTIFLVDASGSSATQRLSEAKGALEELLAQCYIRRDEVAMLSMRGAKVDLVLPPTRSLVRAKRNLATLPGGGGTPLALGLRSANEMAITLERKGLTPIIVIMTDGKANVNLRGVGGRLEAHSDALLTAQELRLKNHRILFVDTSPKPEKLAQELAGMMAAQYFPLPYSGSRKKISDAAIQLANF